MQIVILDGSHNKEGMTQELIKAFSKGMLSHKKYAKIEVIDLLNEKISFCRGCNGCTQDNDPINAPCIIDDMCIEIKKKALLCDVLVFATPIYEYAVSSAMKRFLERCLTLVTFRFGISARAKPLKGKQGVILCPSGAPFPLNHIMGITWYPRYILKIACKLFRCSKVHMIFAGGMALSKRSKRNYEKKAFNLGQKIALLYKKK